MTTNNETQNHSNSDDPLEVATWAVLSQPIPQEAVKRVKERALGLAAQETHPAQPSVSDPAVRSDIRRRGFQWSWLAGPAAVAAALLLVVSFVFVSSETTLADVLEKSFSRPWVHGVTTLESSPDRPPGNSGSGALESIEVWYNSSSGITAVKTPRLMQFFDPENDITSTYKVGADTVVQTLPSPVEMMSFESIQNPLAQLQSATKEADGRFAVTGLSLKSIRVDEHPVTQASFTINKRGNPLATRSCVALIDEESGLLVELSQTTSDGSVLKTVFDYPLEGPTSLADLGVPETAVVVNRRAPTDIRNLEAGWTSARVEFDDYDAIVVQIPDGLKSSVVTSLNADIKRVRRQGNRYRVDQLLRPRLDLQFPGPDVDMNQWWQAHRDDFWSVPLLICDGQTVTYYEMVDGRLRDGKAPNLQVQVRNQHPVHGSGTDRPVAWPHLMPEYAARPHLSLSDPRRRFAYGPLPEDGPDGSVRIVVTQPDAATPEIHRYWLNPEADLCVIQSVEPVFHNRQSDPAKAGQVAYIDTEELLDFQKSPGGHWYPTRIERSTSEMARKQLRTFHIDFDVELEESLFTPLSLDE